MLERARPFDTKKTKYGNGLNNETREKAVRKSPNPAKILDFLTPKQPSKEVCFVISLAQQTSLCKGWKNKEVFLCPKLSGTGL
jgi:hypothetical protein